ncbi:MAG: hypothetical protein Q7U10_10470 [Thermodesulfovibrionia bacterium]|nr:hypothetical protein [Thermodesulfovibrionia bacterium]
MAKKVAIIVKDRVDEALRMGVGATLADDQIHVFIMDKKVEMNADNELNLETMQDLDVKIFTNNPANPYEQKSTEEIAKMLADYDIVVPY